jgi:hypothetical protein
MFINYEIAMTRIFDTHYNDRRAYSISPLKFINAIATYKQWKIDNEMGNEHK